MTSRRFAALATVTLLALARDVGVAQPVDIAHLPLTTLSTAPLHGTSFVCSVTNVGATPLNLTVEIRDRDGVPEGLFLDECGLNSLPPGHLCANSASHFIDLRATYCTVSFRGDARRVRAVLQGFTEDNASVTAEAR